MKLFQINPTTTVICEAQSTRSGFRHLATYMRDGDEVARAKCTYSNRTWESYEFQSVLYKLAESKSLTLSRQTELKAYAKEGDRKPDPMLHATAAVMALGDLFATTQKDQNDWKARMLRAGLEGHGLRMPDDWNDLTENDKTTRLNKVIEHLKG